MPGKLWLIICNLAANFPNWEKNLYINLIFDLGLRILKFIHLMGKKVFKIRRDKGQMSALSDACSYMTFDYSLC